MSRDSAASRATSRYADLLSAIRTLTVEVDAEIDARALLRHTRLPAGKIALEALKIASEICVFTNSEILVEEL